MLRMTYAIANAAATDEANRRMRAAGRTTWNRADYNHAVKTFHKLYSEPDHETRTQQRSRKANRAVGSLP